MQISWQVLVYCLQSINALSKKQINIKSHFELSSSFVRIYSCLLENDKSQFKSLSRSAESNYLNCFKIPENFLIWFQANFY